ncbi:MAG: hypothetical protein AAGH41_09915 [Pseudomonadota bacterium]
MATLRTLLSSLDGRTGEIARTVEREIQAIAPYAELGLAMGVPTWHLHDRVVSLIPLATRCQLHFWQGDQLALQFPGILQATKAGPMRFIQLSSMLDVNAQVKEVIAAAFSLQIAALAREDHTSVRKGAFS